MILPRVDPGYIVVWYPFEQEPMAQLFSTEHAAAEAKRQAMTLVRDRAIPTRVFALVEVFSSTSKGSNRVPDDWAPALDMMVKEQSLGRGRQVALRGPGKKAAVLFREAQEAAEEMARNENRPSPVAPSALMPTELEPTMDDVEQMLLLGMEE